jgi:hypothetical protein
MTDQSLNGHRRVEQSSAAPAVPDDDVDVDYDFDEAWRERKAARVAPRIRILGKVYSLPHSLPAKLILFAVSARTTGRPADDQVTAEEAFDMLGKCQQVYQRRQERSAGNGVAPGEGGW